MIAFEAVRFLVLNCVFCYKTRMLESVVRHIRKMKYAFLLLTVGQLHVAGGSTAVDFCHRLDCEAGCSCLLEKENGSGQVLFDQCVCSDKTCEKTCEAPFECVEVFDKTKTNRQICHCPAGTQPVSRFR